jgi:hypothetical protein
MGVANQNEVAQRGLISLVIYPRQKESDGAVAEPEPPSQRPIPWISSLIVFVLSAGVTFGGVYFREMCSMTTFWSPRFLPARSAEQSLGLHVEYQGERLLVTWNRGSPAIRSAVQGVLRIDDGGRHRDVMMDATQMVAGSILYKPASSDIVFRLEVQNDRGTEVAETIRVLDAGKPPAATPAEKTGASGASGRSAVPPVGQDSDSRALAAPVRSFAL